MATSQECLSAIHGVMIATWHLRSLDGSAMAEAIADYLSLLTPATRADPDIVWRLNVVLAILNRPLLNMPESPIQTMSLNFEQSVWQDSETQPPQEGVPVQIPESFNAITINDIDEDDESVNESEESTVVLDDEVSERELSAVSRYAVVQTILDYYALDLSPQDGNLDNYTEYTKTELYLMSSSGLTQEYRRVTGREVLY
jgi:hypothetical protein